MEERETPILEISHLAAGYGEYLALHDISISVQRRELVSVIGPNGAGKSTLLKTIVGVLNPKEGSIKFEGRDITGLNPRAIAKLGIGYVPQGMGTFPQMSVYENIEAGGYLLKDRSILKERVEDALTLFPRLRERLHYKAFSLSGGERQMLLLSRALMLDPKLLLLDEPSLGLDPKSQALLYGTIQKLNASGKSVLLVEQNVQQALRLASRCYIQEVGRTVYEGLAKDLSFRDKIKSAYLGV
jgi:branched-chain amino acid transport system ATP-binding protein